MIFSSQQANGFQFPYFYGLPYYPGSNYWVMFNCAPGLSYNPQVSTTTFKDLSYYNLTGTTVNNCGASEYKPNTVMGGLHLNNTTGYNPGAGKYVLGNNYSLGDSWSHIVGWQCVAVNQTYGADIIVGAYNSSTHDYWLGTYIYAPNTSYWYSRNGNGVVSGVYPVAGRRYVACIGNDSVTNQGYFGIWDSAGNVYTNGALPYYASTTAGWPAIGKYGQYIDNYLPNIILTDWVVSWANMYQFDFASAKYIARRLAPRLGINSALI